MEEVYRRSSGNVCPVEQCLPLECGLRLNRSTKDPPADWPTRVTLAGSPAKWGMFF